MYLVAMVWPSASFYAFARRNDRVFPPSPASGCGTCEHNGKHANTNQRDTSIWILNSQWLFLSFHNFEIAETTRKSL
jgi:hypothetical protein